MNHTIKKYLILFIIITIIIFVGIYVYFFHFFDFNLTTKNNIISYVSTDGLIITVFKNESPLSINTLEVIVNGRNKTTDTLIFEIYNENIIGIIERDSIISILLNKKGKIDSIKIKKK